MWQRATVSAKVMLGHPSVIEAELFDFNDLLEHAAIEFRKRAIGLGHIGGQHVRAELHLFNVSELPRADVRKAKL